MSESSDGLLRIVIVLAALVVLLPILVMVLVMPFMWTMGGGWGMMDGSMWGAGGGGWGVMFLWPLLLVALGYLAYRALTGSGGLTTDRAVEELRVQYARGELTDEEYDERLRRLERQE